MSISGPGRCWRVGMSGIDRRLLFLGLKRRDGWKRRDGDRDRDRDRHSMAWGMKNTERKEDFWERTEACNTCIITNNECRCASLDLCHA